jgi:CheY-like chemotaxis protein
MTPTLLIVDDSKLARIVLKRAISQLRPGWFLVEVGNADEALAAIEQRQIDLAILDYNLPDRNGIELARNLRARFPKMPIAVATANTQDELITEAHAADAAFIAKPITADGVRGFLSGAALRLGALD